MKHENKQAKLLHNELVASNMDILATIGCVGVETLAKLAKGGNIPEKLDKHKIASKFLRNTIITDVITAIKKGDQK